MNAGLEIKELRERVQVLLEQRSRLEAQVEIIPAMKEELERLRPMVRSFDQLLESAQWSAQHYYWFFEPACVEILKHTPTRNGIKNILNSKRLFPGG